MIIVLANKKRSRFGKIVSANQAIKLKGTVDAKCSKSEIHRKTHGIPDIHFEDQKLISFAGLVLFQPLFKRLDLMRQLTHCFRHLKVSPIFGHGLITLILIVHLLIGCRRLQDLRYYQDDPMVRRLLGVSRLPDVATVSRTLAGMDSRGVDNVRKLNRQMVMDRLSLLGWRGSPSISTAR